MANKLKVILILIFLLAGFFIWYQNKAQVPTKGVEESLKITSTDPNPLDEATILPSQDITITFNRPIYRSELKHRFDPELEHNITVVNGIDKELGKTFKITFKKPLDLGKGYTFFIQSETHDQNGHSLGGDQIYHFRTIGYKGV